MLAGDGEEVGEGARVVNSMDFGEVARVMRST